MNIKSSLLFLLALSILLSCTKQPDKIVDKMEGKFFEAVPVTDMNQSLSLAVDSKEQYFSSGSDIPLLIKNKSSQFILFDPNTHIKLLMNTGDQWVEVENAITYSGTPILPAQNSPLINTQYSDVKPILDENILNRNIALIPLRIVIVGEFMRGDNPTGKKVGAYVDVFLKPTVTAVQPIETIIYSTEVGGTSNGGKIEGIITSKEDADRALSNVTVSLVYHPIFNESGQTQAIAITKTDAQGKYSFDNVKPGVYALHTTIVLESGASCDNFDYARIIKIEIGTAATVNFSLACDHL